MEQTFNDLCRERVKAERGLFSFALWMFFETSAGIIRENLAVNIMQNKSWFATLLTLTLFTAGHAQTLDKAKLDQFFDRLAEKNKAMGSQAAKFSQHLALLHAHGLIAHVSQTYRWQVTLKGIASSVPNAPARPLQS